MKFIFFDVSRGAMQLLLGGVLIFTVVFLFLQATGSSLHDP